jgi:hypothetical protein
MARHFETIEMPSGEIVAVGPFASFEECARFAEHVESTLGLATSHGGMRALSISECARELGVRPAQLRPPTD